MKEKHKKLIVLGVTVALMALFFILTKYISPDYLTNLGTKLPLPIFTILIALVDGFNPCNLFILTMLISLMLAESHSRARILTVGYTFVGVVYIFYFLFMATWLQIFKYIGFVTPLRWGIAALAIIAGIINCKEYFFYRKGITLMIQDSQIGPLKKKIRHVSKLVMEGGSLPALIISAIMLAIFSSLIELPCTAGFPIIYTGILTGMGAVSYYAYLALYNLIYVSPLLILITILAYTFKGKQIDKGTMSLIKFIGGAIMLLLGLILLISPALIGL